MIFCLYSDCKMVNEYNVGVLGKEKEIPLLTELPQYARHFDELFELIFGEGDIKVVDTGKYVFEFNYSRTHTPSQHLFLANRAGIDQILKTMEGHVPLVRDMAKEFTHYFINKIENNLQENISIYFAGPKVLGEGDFPIPTRILNGAHFERMKYFCTCLLSGSETRVKEKGQEEFVPLAEALEKGLSSL